MHLSVRPGAVKQVLTAVDFLDFHLIAYLSFYDEVIICDDANLLQIIPCPANSASIHSKTGKLCLTTKNKMYFFDPKVIYGQTVSWNLSFEDSIGGGLLLDGQFVNEELILVVKEAQLVLWNFLKEYSVTSRNLSLDRVTYSPDLGICLGWNAKTSKIFIFDDVENLERDSIIDLEVSLPKLCYFVGNCIVIRTETSTFVFEHTQLVFSTSLNCAIYFEGSIYVAILGDKIYSVDLERGTILEHSECKLTQGVAITTNKRIVIQNDFELHIYEKDEFISRLGGGFSGENTCIAVSNESILLGKDLVNNEFQFIRKVDANFVLSCFSEEKICLVDHNNELIWNGHKLQLNSSPIGLESTGNCIFVAYNDKVNIYIDGELNNTVNSHVEGMCVYNDLLATFAGSKVQVHTTPLKEYELTDQIISISMQSDWIVAASRNEVQVFSLHDTLFTLPKIILDDIHSVKFNINGTFMAVLTSKSLHIYELTSILQNVIVEIAVITDAFKFLGPANVSWDSRDRIILFDGKQLWFSEPFIHQVHSDELPLFHPWSLVLLAQALKPHIIKLICMKLSTELKFNSSEDNFVEVDPQLGDIDLKSFENDHSITFDNNILLLQLDKINGIKGLTNHEYKQLIYIVKLLEHLPKLDSYAFSSLLLNLVFRLKPQSWIYAYFSATKLELKSLLEDKWHVWLDLTHLKDEVEQQAKIEFAQERDPTKVTLYYLALHKLPVIQTLWRIAGGHPERDKTIKLLKNDFKTERWQSAALKNAYALLSKHRESYAAAFFLLGDSPTDCCSIISNKMKNFELALVIARVYDSNVEENIKSLRSSTTKWDSIFCSVLLNEVPDLESIDPSSILIGLLLGSNISNANEAFINAKINSCISNICRAVKPARQTVVYEPLDPEPQMPTNLKPVSAEIQLEPDMSAFGF